MERILIRKREELLRLINTIQETSWATKFHTKENNYYNLTSFVPDEYPFLVIINHFREEWDFYHTLQAEIIYKSEIE
jgi:hypothetical protein